MRAPGVEAGRRALALLLLSPCKERAVTLRATRLRFVCICLCMTAKMGWCRA